LPQQPIELILLRQWASYLAIPVWLMDAEGNLLYYNEPAEPAIGREFDLAGPVNASELASLFTTTRVDGTLMPNDEIPLLIAMQRRQPAHGTVRFKGLDGEWRLIDVTALPIERAGGELLGVVAMFWEVAP
jgi:PAS domain-containing protein